jgi:predicted enzyme related to lactoylglutathione lyase
MLCTHGEKPFKRRLPHAMSRTLIARLHNPHGYVCACDPDCWCRRTTLGRAVKWWFPARYFGLRHKNSAQAGSVVRVVSVEPIFVVSDVARAVEHYERLGFTTSYHDEGYAFAHRDDLTIHLAGADGSPARAGSIYMHVDDADRLADEWRKAGADVVEPADFDYGKREGSHTDPDGNLIRFGSPLRPGL